MLEAVGIDAEEEHVYLQLVTTFETSPSELAARVGLPLDRVRRLLESLHNKGLVRRIAGEPPSYAPSPPDVGIGPLLLRGQESLDGARRVMTQLGEEYHRGIRRRDPGRLIEVITGREALRQQLHDLQLGAKHEMLWFCKAGHVAMPSSENTEELDMLRAGVKFRVLYEQALLDEPGMLDSVASSVAVGERARAAPVLPVRLAIADQRLALCPLVPLAESHGEPTAALIRESTVLTALIALFESYWERGSPLVVSPSSESVGPLSGDDHQLLSLLVAGVTDKAIASLLAVSQRTVQRRIAELLGRAGAQTRAQLAWQAARLGWLESPQGLRPRVPPKSN